MDENDDVIDKMRSWQDMFGGYVNGWFSVRCKVEKTYRKVGVGFWES